MKRHINIDKHRRFSLFLRESQYVVLRYFLRSSFFTLDSKDRVYKKIRKMLCGRIKFSRVKNYCIVSGRSRSVYKDFRLSRIKFRDSVRSGVVYGLRKSSW